MKHIVYLHGFASGPTSTKAGYFRQFLEEQGAEVEVPDLSEGDFEHLTITGQLALIDRVVGQKTVSLIGSSMGGYLAALYAARNRAVERVVLLAPAFRFAARWRERLGEQQVADWQRLGFMEVFHYGQRRTVRLAPELLDDGGRYEDFPPFVQPALIFHGAQDDVVPATYSKEFAASRANAQLEILDSGHELTDVLEYIAPKIARFLLPGD